MTQNKDYMVSAITKNGEIRAFAATTRNLVEVARQHHNTSPVATAALGRLMTAGCMMGSMMKGKKDVLTLKVDGDGPIQNITVTADTNGNVKGFVGEPMVLIHANSVGKLDVKGAVGAGTLTVIRDIGLKEPYTGQIALVSGELAEDLTYYFATSEQTPSAVGLGVLMNHENTVRAAGGFIIQLLPGASDETITKLEERMSTVTSVTSMLDMGMAPEDILRSLLGDDVEITDKRPLEFRCDCSKERAYKAINSIGVKAISDMIHDGKDIQVHCHFCNTDYTVTVEEMKQMIRDRLNKLNVLGNEQVRAAADALINGTASEEEAEQANAIMEDAAKSLDEEN